MNNYSDKVYELALKELSERRQKAEALYEQRKNEVYRLSPEIRTLNENLASTGAEFLAIMTDKLGNKNTRIEQLKEKNLKMQDQLAVLLKAFKGDESYLDIPYTCKKCEDTGYRGGHRCECFDQLLKGFAAKELTDNSGIELHDFSEFRTDLYQVSDDNGGSPRENMKGVYEYCKNYAETFELSKPSLLFVGMTGVGKTFVSSCIAKTVAQKGRSVVFGSVSTFLRRIEDEHFGRKEGETIDLLSKCDLLILDDLGSEFKTQFTEAVLYEVINSRINMGKPTIISMNMSGSELNSSYNERIVSRLTGCFVPVKFTGRDIRPKLRNC